MADETDISPIIPLVELSAHEFSVDEFVEVATAASRLRSFENDKLGPDAVRINDQIERGYGSKFRDLSAEDQAHHGKLEKLVEAEQKLAEARAVLAAAEAEYAEAEAAVNDA